MTSCPDAVKMYQDNPASVLDPVDEYRRFMDQEKQGKVDLSSFAGPEPEPAILDETAGAEFNPADPFG